MKNSNKLLISIYISASCTPCHPRPHNCRPALYPIISFSSCIDGNYRVITLILKHMAIYPSVWRIMHYFRYPRFLQIFLIYISIKVYDLSGEPSGNIISNYHGTFIHIYMHSYDLMFKIYIWNSYFPWLILPFFLSLSFFLRTIYQKLFHYLQAGFFISADISKFYVMSSPTVKIGLCQVKQSIQRVQSFNTS